MHAIAAGALALAALVPAPAAAQTATSAAVDEAADALRGGDPVYVAPGAEAQVDEQRIEQRIRRGDAGTVFVAVLPESAGQATDAGRRLAQAVGQPGVYAVITGRQFAGGSTAGEPVRDLATEAVEAKRSEGATAIVVDFIDRVAERKAGGSGKDSGSGGVSGTGLLGLLALLGLGGVAAAVISGRRRRRREREQLAEVKTVARDDLVALGDDIRALDLDEQMPDADPEAKRYYGQAVDAYTRAEAAFD